MKPYSTLRDPLFLFVGFLGLCWAASFLPTAARAQDAPPVPPAVAAPAATETYPDPFKPSAAMKALGEGETLPPLSCAKAEVFRAAVKAHGGSRFLKLSALQKAFWDGFYAGMPITAGGYPVGDGAIAAVRVADGDDGKPHMTGVVAYTLGPYLICNVIPVNGAMLDNLFKVGGATSDTD